ncbi:MAG: hypothetical protein KGJ13_09920 [Patescibacteria group bacterium]|nr:hypothetical protein [Patescibacteria group bacterium]
MNPHTLPLVIAGCSAAAIAVCYLCFRVGLKRGDRLGFERGREWGKDEGWNEHYFAQAALERAKRDKLGRFRPLPPEAKPFPHPKMPDAHKRSTTIEEIAQGKQGPYKTLLS